MYLEFAGQSVKDSDNAGADTSRLVNCYRSPLSDGRFAIKSVPGMMTWTRLDGAMFRAFGTVEGVLYAVHGRKLYSFTSGGTALELGDIPDSPDTSISGNNGKVTICANGRYFVWDGTALTEPLAGAFSDFGSVDFIGSRTVLTERNGRRVQWSNLLDPSALNGLAFATTESRDDDNIRGMVFGPEYWIFKQTSIERWVATASGIAPLPGSTIDKGLKAFGLLCKMDTGGFFVGNDGKAYLLAAGGMLQRVSIPPVETSIAQNTPLTAFYYQDEGHEFVALTFKDREAWVFDITTVEWHERGEGNGEPWRARHAGRAHDRFYVANDLGVVSRLSRIARDNDRPLIRRMVSKTVFLDRRFTVPMLAFRLRTGIQQTLDGLTVYRLMLDEDGNAIFDPESGRYWMEFTDFGAAQVSLRTSRDRGLTWGAPKPRGIGLVGQYETRVAYRALGQFRDFTAELTMADVLECPVESVADLVIA